MKELLDVATENAVHVIDFIALIVISLGTLEAFVRGIAVALTNPDPYGQRDVWLRYARWLVAGLTFQLASDIIETSVAPTWADIGRLGAIAVIRTFLNFFLERDVGEMRERQHKPAHA